MTGSQAVISTTWSLKGVIRSVSDLDPLADAMLDFMEASGHPVFDVAVNADGTHQELELEFTLAPLATNAFRLSRSISLAAMQHAVNCHPGVIVKTRLGLRSTEVVLSAPRFSVQEVIAEGDEPSIRLA